MPFTLGENIGPYRIVEQLGQGGMATVFKAYHAALDRYVAIKALHPAFGEDPNFEARFQREARLVAKLEHPNIVPVYDYAEQDGRPYLVMKYIEGDTLKARLAQGPLTSEEINKVVDSVGPALAYAHKNGVLHRDIKPSNVLLSTDGEMYLADFGLARIAQSGESTLSSDMIMGTPQYISPEQAMGKKDLDEGTDIYSFGVMLYEMVVGQVPFNADTPFSIIHDHIYTPLPMPRAVNADVPEGVERVLLKALAKERTDRYPDVPSMTKAFKQAWIDAGVPMQGTSLTLPAVAPKSDEKPARKQEKKAPAQPAGGATVAAGKPQKKQRSPWPLLATGLLGVLCLTFVLLAFRSGRLRALQSTTAPSLPPPTSQPATHPAVSPSAQPTAAQITPTVAVDPLVQAALDKVQQNPIDAQANLELALAYWDTGQPRKALETLGHAADLAGPNNTNFFLDAGDQFRERESWIAAAAMYLRAIKTYGLNPNIPREIEVPFHESVYKASVEPDMPAYLPFEAIARVDQPIALVAEARHELYNGDPEQARIKLNNVFHLSPEYPEARLVNAELLTRGGRIQEARQILNDLIANISNPEWIQTEAQAQLDRMP